MKIIAVIGDIIGSRSIPDRRVLQTALIEEFRAISTGRADILSPYTLTLGDEFQVVYSAPENLFSDIWRILRILHPHQARFSVSVGQLSTSVNREQAIGMDGPVFHDARDQISRLKKSSSFFHISDPGSDSVALINSTLSLVSRLCTGWKRNRLEIIIRLMEGHSPKLIAQELELSENAVYKNINAGALNTVIQIFQQIRIELQRSMQKS